MQAINRIAQTTSFQGKNLLDGTLGFTATPTAAHSMDTVNNLQISQANLGTAGSMAVAGTITSAATQASITDTIGAGAVAATNSWTLAERHAHADGGHRRFGHERHQRHFQYQRNVTAANPIVTYNSTAKTLNITINDSAATTLADLGTAVTAATGGAVIVGGTAANIAVADKPALVTQNLVGGADAGGGLADALNFTLTGDKGSQVFSFQAGTTGTMIAAAIHNSEDTTGVDATFAGSTLTFKATDWGKAGSIAIAVNSEGTPPARSRAG